jgi:hypothetical protein
MELVPIVVHSLSNDRKQRRPLNLLFLKGQIRGPLACHPGYSSWHNNDSLGQDWDKHFGGLETFLIQLLGRFW